MVSGIVGCGRPSIVRLEDWDALEGDDAPRARPPFRGLVVAAVLCILPWSWFLVRDRAPIMDLVAVALPPLGVGAAILILLVAAVWRSWLGALVAFSVAAFTVVAVAGPRTPQAAPAPQLPLRLAAANVYELNERPGDAVDALLARDANVLAVLEGEPDITEPLNAAFKHALDEGHMSMYSDYPMRELPSGASIRHQRVMRARIWGPAGPFILFLVHQMNPLYDAAFSEQTQDLQALVARASSEKQPVVLAGDFNMSDRSRGYRELSDSFRDAMRAGTTAGSTYENGLWSGLFLRIDHIFTTPAWCAANGRPYPVPGSDHEGIEALLGPCSQAAGG